MSDWHAAYTTTYVQVTADMNGSLDTTEEAPGRNSVERIQAIHANASAHADAAAMAARADVVAQQELLLRGGFEEEDSDDDMPQLFEHSQGGHAAGSVSEEEDSGNFVCQSTTFSVSDATHTITYIRRCEKITRVRNPILYNVHVCTAFDHTDLHTSRITIILYEIWTL